MKLEDQRVHYTPFPFASLAKIEGALCSDGKQRTATVTGQPDTFFSVPARVSVKGKTVSGFLTKETLAGYSTETPDDPAVWKFIAYSYGKNGALLPGLAYRPEEKS